MSDPSSNESPNILVVSGVFDPASMLTQLHLPDGRVVQLPTALLETDSMGKRRATERTGVDTGASSAREEPIVIPVIEERLEVGRRTVATGTVRLEKTIQEFETQLDEPLAVRTFDVERLLLNQPVESAPAVRQEGDTTIYPVVEEQLILTKQLVLKEELRITRRDTERRDTQTVTLRREHITVERDTA